VHVTSVFVTHDQEEALEVADRVVVMNEGRIEQVGDARRGLRPARRQPGAKDGEVRADVEFLGDVNAVQRQGPNG
jgi:ABC-type sulfate/molybdate transport systems ATPase subunit